MATFAALLLSMIVPACGSSAAQGSGPDGGAVGSGGGGGGDGAAPPILGGDGGPSSTGDGGCTGLQCQQQPCSGNATTSISGTVYDPAGANPLYNVVVYVPNATPAAITPGIDASSCSCDALYTGQPIATALTDATGHFVLANAPVGTDIPLVLQIGKWRKQMKVSTVTACQDNPQPDKSLTLPRTHLEGDIPSIAVSTGNADTLECLLLRMGVDASEFGAGAAGSGRVHVFVGGDPGDGSPTMPGAPTSAASLWDSAADLRKYDIVLLSCEGHETTSPDPKNLGDYVNAGGRAFAEHYHYAWFTNDPKGNSPFVGANLAAWSPVGNGGGGGSYTGTVNAIIQKTLPSGAPFPEGQALDTWLGKVGALDANGELPILVAKHNALVGASNVATPWAQTDPSASPASTEYFSFDTPLGAPKNDAGQPAYCGRVVFSDLHVSGGGGGADGGSTTDQGEVSQPVPTGCTAQPLSADEDALEFMLFDLSSCVTPVGSTPQPPPPIPK